MTVTPAFFYSCLISFTIPVAAGLSPWTQGISALNSISVLSMAIRPSLHSYMTKASMRFYILGFQTLRMGKGKGLQGFYLIDNPIMNLLKGSIYISSYKAHEVWKSGMGFHLSMN